jgi:predicted DNA-binding transcriptional regulator YafY
MPKKMNPDLSHSEKLIKLFAMLFFRPGSRSLTQLSDHLGCSKQTVQLLIQKVESGFGVQIERQTVGNRLFYVFSTPRKYPPAAMLTNSELNTLQMCRAFTEHLMGTKQFSDTMLALEKSTLLLPDGAGLPESHFGVMRFGSIDYSPYQKQLLTLVEAMEKKRVCEITYRKIGEPRAKRSRIKPLKIFAQNESVYVHARYAKMPGQPFKVADYDPLLALQRFKTVKMVDTRFVIPKNYDFDRSMNKQFGVIHGKQFKVVAEFTGWAAGFVAERIWSPDQKISHKQDGRVRVEFSSSSEPEVLTWILRFGDEAKLIGPRSLVNELKSRLSCISELYS